MLFFLETCVLKVLFYTEVRFNTGAFFREVRFVKR